MILLDFLSNFFLTISLGVSVLLVLYSFGFTKFFRKEYSAAFYWLILFVFIFSVVGVLRAADMISFLFLWELMSLCGFLMLIFDYRNYESVKSAVSYFVLSHISVGLLIIIAQVIYNYTGTYDFSVMREGLKAMDSQRKHWLGLAAFFAFAVKSDLFPFNGWISKSYSNSPSPSLIAVSSVMVNISVFGFIKIFMDLLNLYDPTFSILIMLIGIFTAVYSSVTGLFKNNYNEFLGYSTVENMGLIYATLGLSMFLKTQNFNELSSLAFVAALFHTFNHSIFKTLLLMSYGSLKFTTDEKNTNKLGALQKYNKTAFYGSLAGSLAMSGIPPFNGFASEILIIQTFILSIQALGGSFSSLIVLISTVFIGLTCGLVLYSTVKNFGMTFLGQAKDTVPISTRKPGFFISFAVVLSSLLSLAAGFFSSFIIDEILKIGSSVWGDKLPEEFSKSFDSIMMFGFFILMFFMFFVFIRYLLGTFRKKEVSDTWACGHREFEPKFQYTSSGYAQPASKLFKNAVSYSKKVQQKKGISISISANDMLQDYVYPFFIWIFGVVSRFFHKIQHGYIQLYVLYFAVTLALTIFLVLKG